MGRRRISMEPNLALQSQMVVETTAPSSGSISKRIVFIAAGFLVALGVLVAISSDSASSQLPLASEQAPASATRLDAWSGSMNSGKVRCGPDKYHSQAPPGYRRRRRTVPCPTPPPTPPPPPPPPPACNDQCFSVGRPLDLCGCGVCGSYGGCSFSCDVNRANTWAKRKPDKRKAHFAACSGTRHKNCDKVRC